MNFAAINWLSISINLLEVVFVIVCFLMILLILMQRPKQEGLGAAFGAGVTDQVFGARTTNVLQRGTVYLGSLFFLLSLTLAVLVGHKNKQIHMLAPKQLAPKVEEAKPAKPDESGKPKSLSEELPADDKKPEEKPAEKPVGTPEVVPPVPPTPAPADKTPPPASTTPEGSPPKPAETPAPSTTPPAAPAESSAPGNTPPVSEEKSDKP